MHAGEHRFLMMGEKKKVVQGHTTARLVFFES